MSSSPNVAARFYGRLADVCLRLRSYPLAAKAYERMLRILPDDRHVQSRHAWTLLHVPHRRNEGIAKLQLLLQATPDSDEFGHLGYALWEEHRYEEAVQADREAVRLNPWSAAHHHNLGVSLIALRRPEEAVEAYREAIRLGHPDAAGLHSVLGDNLVALGRLEEAVQAYGEAARLGHPPTADRHYSATAWT